MPELTSNDLHVIIFQQKKKKKKTVFITSFIINFLQDVYKYIMGHSTELVQTAVPQQKKHN